MAIAEQAASVCYDSKPTENLKIVKQCIASRHMSVLEHVSFTFHIQGISRACLAQLSRHRHISLSVRSQRYCREDNFEFVNPFILGKFDEFMEEQESEAGKLEIDTHCRVPGLREGVSGKPGV